MGARALFLGGMFSLRSMHLLLVLPVLGVGVLVQAIVCIIVVIVMLVTNSNVNCSVFFVSNVHHSVVILARVVGSVQVVTLVTIVLVTWLAVQGGVGLHTGQLLLVPVGLLDGPLLVPGAVEKEKKLYKKNVEDIGTI